MFVLAQISTLGAVLVAVAAGWLFVHLVRGRQGAARCGGGLKILGVAAIAAGIGYFWLRHEPHRFDHARPGVISVDADEDFAGELGPRRRALYQRVDVAPARWVFVLLGSALVILGALLFGRSSTRPAATKAVTFLGIGAIVYAVVTYLGHPPSGPRAVTGVMQLPPPPADGEFERPARAERHSSRAKRPALRPERPTGEAVEIDALPPRAGGIPVSAELEVAPVAASEAEPAEASQSGTESAPPEPSPSDAPSPEAPPEPAPVYEALAAPAPPADDKPTADEPVADKPAAAIQVPDDAPRPEWVDAPAGLTAGSVYSMTVHSGRFTSVPECQRALEREVKRAADQYIDDYLDGGASEVIDIPLSYLSQHVKKAEYAEAVHSDTVGPMHEIHARLEFDNRVRADFHRLRRNSEVAHRLWYTGGGAALVLAFLATLYGYLKLDLRTGGKNTSRLQLAATLVALVVAAGVLLVRYAVPF